MRKQMTVRELSPDQMRELKNHYLVKVKHLTFDPEEDDVDDFITDEEMYKIYANETFTDYSFLVSTPDVGDWIENYF